MKTVALAVFLAPVAGGAAEVLFEDDFDKGLSPKWQAVGLDEDDYRVRDGGLEMRVANSKAKDGWPGKNAPRLKLPLKLESGASFVASVEVKILNRFTESEETAGLYLIDEDGLEFRATKTFVGWQMVFSPPRYIFEGKGGEEGDPDKYDKAYQRISGNDGPLRILVRGNYAHFQVGPKKDKKYLNLFHSAIRSDATERGFALSAGGAPKEEEHWVRFDNFRVERD